MRRALMLRHGRRVIGGQYEEIGRLRPADDRLATAGHAKHRYDRLQRYGFKRPAGARGFADGVCPGLHGGVSVMTLAQSGRAMASHAIGRRFESGTSLVWIAQTGRAPT